MSSLTAKSSVYVAATPTLVWKALTTPSWIKKYFFETDVDTDWKVGSPILFRGSWEGESYIDKGVILQSEPLKLFRYTYLSSFTNLPDLPENYQIITYELQYDADKSQTYLIVTQSNVLNEEAKNNSEYNWSTILTEFKELVEGM